MFKPIVDNILVAPVRDPRRLRSMPMPDRNEGVSLADSNLPPRLAAPLLKVTSDYAGTGVIGQSLFQTYRSDLSSRFGGVALAFGKEINPAVTFYYDPERGIVSGNFGDSKPSIMYDTIFKDLYTNDPTEAGQVNLEQMRLMLDQAHMLETFLSMQGIARGLNMRLSTEHQLIRAEIVDHALLEKKKPFWSFPVVAAAFVGTITRTANDLLGEAVIK